MTGTVGDFSLSDSHGASRTSRTSCTSGARTRTISRPLPRLSRASRAQTQTQETPPFGFLAPSPAAPATLLIPAVPTTARALRRQRHVAQQLAVDMANVVIRLSLLDVFGPTFTKAQRWDIRDALRSVYLPLLRAAAAADAAALAASADDALAAGQQ